MIIDAPIVDLCVFRNLDTFSVALHATDMHELPTRLTFECLECRDLSGARSADPPGLLKNARLPHTLGIGPLRNIVVSPRDDDAPVPASERQVICEGLLNSEPLPAPTERIKKHLWPTTHCEKI